MATTLNELRHSHLVIVRRLRNGPLTEFELAHEVAESSSYSEEQAADRMEAWLEELRVDGLIWSGRMTVLSLDKRPTSWCRHCFRLLICGRRTWKRCFGSTTIAIDVFHKLCHA